MSIKKFKDFINEYDSPELKTVNVAGQKTNLKNDKKLDKEVEKYMDDIEEECPRCGERFEECRCENDDFWSTHTYHRIPKGDNVEVQPSQKFNKE